LLARDHKTAELRFRRGLASAELDASVGHQVEGVDALDDARRMVEVERDLDDAVAEADAVGALRRGGEKDLGRRGVAVLLEEVVLDLPDAVHASLVGQLHLLEGALEELVLGVGAPRAGELVLVEQAELHGEASKGMALTASSNRRSRAGRPPASRADKARRRLRRRRSRAARAGHGRRRS